MRKLLAAFLVLAVLAQAAPYPPAIVHVLEQLRTNVYHDLNHDLPLIDGRTAGYAGTPGTFYLLYPFCEYRTAQSDLLKMLFDPSPAVRLMAAKVLLHSKLHASDAANADFLLGDSAKVMLAVSGDAFEATTVGEVVKRLKADKQFLGDNSGKAADPAVRFPGQG